MHPQPRQRGGGSGRGGSPLAFDVPTSGLGVAPAAKRGLEISAIFRRVFGDAAMMTRVRPLLIPAERRSGDAHRSAGHAA